MLWGRRRSQRTEGGSSGICFDQKEQILFFFLKSVDKDFVCHDFSLNYQAVNCVNPLPPNCFASSSNLPKAWPISLAIWYASPHLDMAWSFSSLAQWICPILISVAHSPADPWSPFGCSGTGSFPWIRYNQKRFCEIWCFRGWERHRTAPSPKFIMNRIFS